MTDKFSPSKRKAIMQSIQGKDSRPEKIVRSMIFKLGFRYRLHDALLPGKPDLVFKSAKKIIFVHGCYWHRHNCKKGNSIPVTNQEFWKQKFAANKKRDKEVRRKLRKEGWKILIIWECETRKTKRSKLVTRIIKFLTNQ
jgi:DNA mismatch endonuclease (patch repair protein)